ncbi:MAG TPA: hypothetical protein VHY08_07730 [Bacillota bacterium]|nr:hypothetical protein [Bacillota bacterium]
MRKFTWLALVLLLVFLCGIGLSYAATPKILIYAKGADPRGLDPAYVDDGESAKIIVNIYDKKHFRI